MARIAGVDIPKNKRGVIALTYIFGIGKSRAIEILEKAQVSQDTKVQDWNDDQIHAIREAVSFFKIEGELRSEVSLHIKRLMDIGCYRGIRHRSGLPLRGQRWFARQTTGVEPQIQRQVLDCLEPFSPPRLSEEPAFR